GHGLVGAVEELDGHEDHLLVAEILEVVYLELAGPVGLVARLARLVGVFHRGAVMHVLAAAPAGDRGPEIVEHVAVEADALAGRQPDHPYPHPVALRYQGGAHARIGVFGLALELRLDLGRPRTLVRTFRGFIHHRQGHIIPPAKAGLLYSAFSPSENRQERNP